MTIPAAETQQLVIDYAADDGENLKRIIAELETENATIQYEVWGLSLFPIGRCCIFLYTIYLLVKQF